MTKHAEFVCWVGEKTQTSTSEMTAMGNICCVSVSSFVYSVSDACQNIPVLTQNGLRLLWLKFAEYWQALSSDCCQVSYHCKSSDWLFIMSINKQQSRLTRWRKRCFWWYDPAALRGPAGYVIRVLTLVLLHHGPWAALSCLSQHVLIAAAIKNEWSSWLTFFLFM